MESQYALLLMAAVFAYLVWLAYDTSVLTDPEGDLKRGVAVLREQLPEELHSFLAHLPGDIIEEGDFIRKDGNLVLVKKRLGGKVFMHEVALIDLDPDHPQIKYLVPLSQLVLIILLSLTIIFLPVTLISSVANHVFHRNAILGYIRSQMEAAGQPNG